jgi:hypothetical protein
MTPLTPHSTAETQVRVALLSDTHDALDRRVAALVETCDVAIHAGDIGSPEILAQMLPRSGRVFAVRGNNDTIEQWPKGTAACLRILPDYLELELPGGVLVVEHGHRVRPALLRHAALRQRHPQARAIVYGHTHRLVVDDTVEPWVLNPGAAGRTRTQGSPSCLVLIASPTTWHVDIHAFRGLS